MLQDNDPYSLSSKGGLEDISLIQKYRMADEDYDKVGAIHLIK